MKNIRNKKNHTFQDIKNKEGKILRDKKAITKRWKQYFQELLTNEETKQGQEQETSTAPTDEPREGEIRM